MNITIQQALDDSCASFSYIKALHSTETCPLKLTNNVHLKAEMGEKATVILQVHQSIKVKHGLASVSFGGIFFSFLLGRNFLVNMDYFSLSTAHTVCGAPQGSTLGPIFLSI